MVARSPRHRASSSWLSTTPILLALGCASPSATRDYERAADIVHGRTGARISAPADCDAADAVVRELLADGLTVEEAAQIALINNPAFQSALAEIGASRADVAQSALLTNPSLSLGLQFPEGGGLTDLTIGFAAQLADLWQLPVRRQIAEAELERTINQVGQRAVELVTEVRRRCYRVLALEQALAFVEENQRLGARVVELSTAQFKAGEVSEFDVNLARTGALDAQEELIATRGELAQARVDLAEMLGLGGAMEPIRLVGALPAPSSDARTLEELVDTAMDQRFDLRVAWFATQRAEAALRLEARRFLPDVQLGFAFERSEQRAIPGRNVLADTARASVAAGRLTAPSIQSRGERQIEKSQIIDAKLGPTLAMTLPLFDWNEAQIAKARVRVLQARKDYDALAQTAIAEVTRAHALAEAAREMLEFQKGEAIELAEATLTGAEQRYQAGEEGLLALIDAQEALVRRRRAYAAALRDYSTALATLEGAIGGRAGQSGDQMRE
ncbi:MAG: TolC family protein [Phycisphaerales bacterium]|nr:TolC family protein [Phycisphaerales bacterium]